MMKYNFLAPDIPAEFEEGSNWEPCSTVFRGEYDIRYGEDGYATHRDSEIIEFTTHRPSSGWYFGRFGRSPETCYKYTVSYKRDTDRYLGLHLKPVGKKRRFRKQARVPELRMVTRHDRYPVSLYCHTNTFATSINVLIRMLDQWWFVDDNGQLTLSSSSRTEFLLIRRSV